jgi:hypothetical protein
MVVPDFMLIAEIMLVAEGFIDARILSRKFLTLYTLCKDLLSKQDHYDWGLRAIKSVLVVAGALKRGDKGRPEEQVRPESRICVWVVLCGIIFESVVLTQILIAVGTDESTERLQHSEDCDGRRDDLHGSDWRSIPCSRRPTKEGLRFRRKCQEINGGKLNLARFSQLFSSHPSRSKGCSRKSYLS